MSMLILRSFQGISTAWPVYVTYFYSPTPEQVNLATKDANAMKDDAQKDLDEVPTKPIRFI